MSSTVIGKNKTKIRKYFLGAAFLLIGLLIAIGPQTIFAVCPKDPDSMAMACYYTARISVGIGTVIAALGLIQLVIRNNGFGSGISTAELLLGILILLVPTILVGVCKGEHMHCHSVTLPALIILGVLLIVLSVTDIVIGFVGRNKRNTHEK